MINQILKAIRLEKTLFNESETFLRFWLIDFVNCSTFTRPVRKHTHSTPYDNRSNVVCLILYFLALRAINSLKYDELRVHMTSQAQRWCRKERLSGEKRLVKKKMFFLSNTARQNHVAQKQDREDIVAPAERENGAFSRP